MQEKGNKKNMIVIAVIIVVIGVAAYYFVTRDQSSPDLLTGSIPGAGISVDGDLISALSSLRRLRLDDAVFKSPAWGTLVDFSQTLEPLPAGRPNPFAAFPGASTAAVAQ